MIHCKPAWSKPKAFRIAGSATLTIEMSSTTRNWHSARTTTVVVLEGISTLSPP